MTEKPKSAPDFYIKAKDSVTGKYRIAGAAWNRSGQYGDFVSLSIGPPEKKISYIMVPVEKNKEEPKSSVPTSLVPELDDTDSIPF